jgi:RHS repeat-associated protein
MWIPHKKRLAFFQEYLTLASVSPPRRSWGQTGQGNMKRQNSEVGTVLFLLAQLAHSIHTTMNARSLSTFWRTTLLLAVLLVPVWSWELSAQSLPPSPGGPPQLKLETPQPGPVPQQPVFSESPTTAEIARARVFEEPLIPLWGEPSPEENKALAKALLAFSTRVKTDDFSALTGFLDSTNCFHWCPSLLFSIGWEYYHTGYFSRAIAAWEEAWLYLQDEASPAARRLADRTLGELAKMYSRIGEQDRLERILSDFGDRRVSGPATELMSGAKQALWLMKHRPEVAFRCGPLALKTISKVLPATEEDVTALVQQSASTYRGYSLAQLEKLSQDLGLHFQMANRTPGAEVIVPSVVHWKVDHYAAITAREGDRYLVVDPTFRSSMWISREALDEEASGYFAISGGALPRGWRSVGGIEAGTVWGKGVTGHSDPNSTTPYDLKARPDCGSVGLATYNIHLLLASLNIEDTPLFFTPPRGPAIGFTVTYNQREANQPANFSYFNFGQKWTCDWISYIKDNGTNTPADVEYYVSGGGTEIFTGFNTTNQAFDIQWRTQTILLRLSPTSYEMRFPDGSRRIFSQPDGTAGSSRKVFLTHIIDPTGYTNLLHYDSDLRLATVTDPQDGRTNLTFYYNSEPIAGSTNTVQKVADRYGRSAIFGYQSLLSQLESIRDPLGMTSKVFYAHSTVERLETPYGPTSFATGDNGKLRWLEATDPHGDRVRVEFNESPSTGIPSSEPGNAVPQGMLTRNFLLYGRNTFYWDKKAMREAPGKFSNARIYHWLHSSDFASATGVLESYKEPLENRVWFNYPGQSGAHGATITGTMARPSVIGRVLDNGTQQFHQFGYNSLGNVTNIIDPVGRRFSLIYATNGVDLLEVRQTRGTNNELLASFTYNDKHLPLTATDAAGQTTRYGYNSFGQLTKMTNALNEVTSFNYATNGLLLNIDGPLPGTNDTISFTYDSFDRVRTMTGVDGYTVTTDYDALDRPLTNSFPDGTAEVMTYKFLDLETYKNRGGQVTRYVHDSLRQLTEIHEATNWVTRLDWCRCGDLGSITDPLGQVTRFSYDIQGRLTARQYADGSERKYIYEKTTSRLRQFTNERGQTRTFYYTHDDNLLGILYADPQVTPTILFSYDTNYNRITQVVDGTGTNTYIYHPITSTPNLGAGRLKSIDGPYSNDTVEYTYDALGRIIRASAFNSVFGQNVYQVDLRFDVLGRVQYATNKFFGAYTYEYAGATDRLTALIYPEAAKVAFEYYNAAGDFRLKNLTNSTLSGALISRFSYKYDSAGLITNWVQQASGQSPVDYDLEYDALAQLTNAVRKVLGSTTNTYSYIYDGAGNRTSEKLNSTTYQAWFNPLNQIAGQNPGSAVASRTLEFDEENRVIAIVESDKRTEILYDAFGRWSVMWDKTGDTAVATHVFFWSGDKLWQQAMIPPSGPTIYRWYYDHAYFEQFFDAPGYFTHDHLGSVREVLNLSGTVGLRYDYDPYGRRVTISNLLDPVLGDYRVPFVGYSGLFATPRHNLVFARHRLYDPDLGRWISRDPIGEEGGLNLYRYAGNDPINYLDPDGLCPQRGFAGGPGQFRDPNTGLIRNGNGSISGDQLNPFNRSNFKGPVQALPSGAGPYRHVGGHHIHAKRAFEGTSGYNPLDGFAVSDRLLAQYGVRHADITSAQQRLFRNLVNSGAPNTLTHHSRIAYQAMVEAGMPSHLAKQLVLESQRRLIQEGAFTPLRIPWGPR